MKFLKKLFDENYCEVEEIIDYDDYRIVSEDGMVYTYTCPECNCYIQVFVNDK